jgi:C4-dicarboxylate-specific signal transduction histidine kinase
MTRLRLSAHTTWPVSLRIAHGALREQLLAAAIAALAGGGALLAEPRLGGGAPLLFVLAVLVSAVLGGWRSAASATVLLAVAAAVLDVRAGLSGLDLGVRSALFLAVAGAITLVAHRLEAARRAEAAAARAARPDSRTEELHAQLLQIWSLNSMGEMASVLAHELNQPLTAVANYLRAARTLIANLELEDDDLMDAVARAGDQAIRAGEIIRTMRDLATRGGAQQQPESLSAILKEIDFIISLMARDAGVRVTYDLDRSDDTVLADRVQIQQLVVNLVRNAVEALTKYPTRQIRISTRPDGNAFYLTVVEDSGPGIDESISDRLFQPLSSTKSQGMGLGLSISSAIVENHGGRIWVEPSRLGGAAFCFVLARAEKDGVVSVRPDSVRR